MMNDESYELLKQMIRENPYYLRTCSGVYSIPKTNECKIKHSNCNSSLYCVSQTNNYRIQLFDEN